MFGRLMTLVRGGAAGSNDGPPAENPADNPADNDSGYHFVAPMDRWMQRTKHERDDVGTAVPQAYADVDARGQAHGDAVVDDGPPAKKARTDVQSQGPLTPESSGAPPGAEDSKIDITPSRKRHRSCSDYDDTPAGRRQQAWKNLMEGDTLGDAPNTNILDEAGDGEEAAANGQAATESLDEASQSDADPAASSLAAGLRTIAEQHRAPPTSRTRLLASPADGTATIHLRRCAKKALKKMRSDREASDGLAFSKDRHSASSVVWPGSSTIPGSTLRKAVDEDDKIELPRRRTRQKTGDFIGKGARKSDSMSRRRFMGDSASQEE